jgi:hypothetical protein
MGKAWILFCPAEMRDVVNGKSSYNEKRKTLFDQPYLTCLLQKDGETIRFVKTYRPQHTTSYNLIERRNTLDEPLALGAPYIFGNNLKNLGLAIRTRTDAVWRVHWISPKVLSEVGKKDVVFLPPYESLPLLDTNSIQRVLGK